MSSDTDLWVRFFRHAQIYPVDALIAGFRLHRDSLALSNMQVFNQIVDELVDTELSRLPDYRMVKLLRQINRTIGRIPKVRVVWQQLVLNSLYGLPGPDWPPIIEYQHETGKWGFRRK
jgi:hypothetical protein